MYCRERVAQLRDHEEGIAAAGVGLAAVGTGARNYARSFKRERSIGFPLLADGELVTYEMIGTGRLTLPQLLRPSVLASGFGIMRRGGRQGRTGKHPTVLGATHLIRPDGTIPFAWVNATVADEAPLAEVLAATGAA